MSTFATRHEDLKAKFATASTRHANALTAAIAAALASPDSAGKPRAELVRQSISAAMTTVMDGRVTSKVMCSMEHWPVTFDVSASVDRGVSEPPSKKEILELAAVALKAAKDAPKPAAAVQAAFTLNPTALKATRAGEWVVFESSQIPEWGMRVAASDFTGTEPGQGREAVAARVRGSLQGYVVSQLNLRADFGDQPFSLPVVASVVTRRATPTTMPSWAASNVLGSLAENTERRDKLVLEAAQNGTPRLAADVTSPELRDQQRLAVVARRETEAFANEWVRQNLRGSNPKLKAADFSGVVEDSMGRRSGAAIYAFQYWGDKSTEEVSIAVPYDDNGRPSFKATSRTAADVAAASKKKRDLEILSEQERQTRLSQFKKDGLKENALLAGLGIQAATFGYGRNMQQTGPVDLIPVRKTMLPDAVSKPGAKIMIDGALYILEETDWQTTSVEKSCHWMARLIPDGKPSQADHKMMYASVADILSGIGGR